jgi:hypothetical protein
VKCPSMVDYPAELLDNDERCHQPWLRSGMFLAAG